MITDTTDVDFQELNASEHHNLTNIRKYKKKSLNSNKLIY